MSREALITVQRTVGNAAVSRLFLGRAPPAAAPVEAPGGTGRKVSALMGEANHLEQRIAISEDLVDMLSPDDTTGEDPAKELELIEPKDKERVANTEVKGSAFVAGSGDAHSVDPNDVRQGKLADCYLFAAMMAVARAKPDRILKLITKKSDGTYDVTLHVKAHAWSWSASPTVINVTSTFPTLDKVPIYAKTGDTDKDGPELWAMLIEKAYAVHMGGYKEIVDGSAGAAAAMLTGGELKTRQVADFLPIQIAQIIDYALRDHKAVTASAAKMGESETPAERKARSDAGVVAHHAYAAIGADVENETLDLLNPWGHRDLMALSIEDVFKKYFVTFAVVTT